MRPKKRTAPAKSRRDAEKNVEPAQTDLTRDVQAGDLQGLSNVEDEDSESVRELAEEGQVFEAEVVDAVENPPDPDVAEVTTKEVPEDDVPPEYLDDQDRP